MTTLQFILIGLVVGLTSGHAIKNIWLRILWNTAVYTALVAIIIFLK